MKILIADDEKFMREDLQKAVERVCPGNTYFFAENYDSAVQAVRENEIEVAFRDIRMPGKTGLELAKAIRELRPAINIIIVTAYTEYALNALRLYVSGYILKPVMDSELKEALEHLRVPVAKKGRAEGSRQNASAILKFTATEKRFPFPAERERSCSPI